MPEFKDIIDDVLAGDYISAEQSLTTELDNRAKDKVQGFERYVMADVFNGSINTEE